LLLLIEFRRFMSAFYGRYVQPAESFQAQWDFIERALRAREDAQKL